MTTTRTASCVFCGRTAKLRPVTAAVELDCAACGSFELTLGVIAQLRTDAHAKTAVQAEIRRQLDSGVERVRVNIETIKALKGR